MTNAKTDFIHALDPVAWARDNFGFQADPWQERLLTSTSRQIIATCSRQSGKSTTVGHKCAHVALYEPRSLIVMIAPSQRQSVELFSKSSIALKDLTPTTTLESDNRLSCKLSNGSRIVALPGDGRKIRGFSAPRLVVIDESAFVDQGTYEAVRPMLATAKTGQIILLSTPNGRRGFHWDAWSSVDSAWERFEVTADQCPRISPEFLANERASLPPHRFASEYFCSFNDSETSLFDFDLIQAAFDPNIKPMFTPEQLAEIDRKVAS